MPPFGELMLQEDGLEIGMFCNQISHLEVYVSLFQPATVVSKNFIKLVGIGIRISQDDY